MKIKLILQPEEFTSFTSYYLESLWREYFDIEWYDSSKTYNRKNTVFVFWFMNANSHRVNQLKQAGYCVAIDHLWESFDSTDSSVYWITNDNWFWYNESLWWQTLGYNNYTPNRSITYRAFMPIRKSTPDRDLIVKHLESLLESMIWSYNSKSLPDDTDDPNQGQRYYHPTWYDNTYSSLVIETNQYAPLFISEKSFKPLAFYHPYQIFGVAGILKKLRSLGFETYENLFDESYDDVEDFELRLQKIINNLQTIEIKSYDQLTEQKMQHNHNRFFNTQLVKQKIVEEIINPLIEHVHKNT